jgi:hypothetical protein
MHHRDKLKQMQRSTGCGTHGLHNNNNNNNNKLH